MMKENGRIKGRERYNLYSTAYVIYMKSYTSMPVLHCPLQDNFRVNMRRAYLGSRIIQGKHKRMVQFHKLLNNLFLTLHGHNIHCRQRELKFLKRYQQYASHAYYGAAGQVSKTVSQQEKAFYSYVLHFEGPDL
jgi:hypothetical protein